jgi:hypothetical protein
MHILKILNGGLKVWQIKKQVAQKKAYKTYNSKSIQLAVNYRPTDIKDGERVKAYLEQTGQSANSYIKALIKADLDAKGFNVNSAATMDIDSVDTL